jgi:uncharacterized RDD family membrane protein YckC
MDFEALKASLPETNDSESSAETPVTNMPAKSGNVGFFPRFLAKLIGDLLFLNILAGTLAIVTTAVPQKTPANLLLPLITVFLFMVFLRTLVTLLLRTFLISKAGGSFGKLLMGLKIVDYDNNQNVTPKIAFLRYLAGYSFSTKFAGLGYWVITKDTEKLAYHDKLFNTKVIKKGSPIPGIVAFIILLISFAFLMTTTIKTWTNMEMPVETPMERSPKFY